MSELEKLVVAKHYYEATKKLVLRMFEDGIIPKEEPKIEVDANTGRPKRISPMLWQKFWTYWLFKQMLTDNVLIEGYLIGAEITPIYSTKQIKNKYYKTVKFEVKL